MNMSFTYDKASDSQLLKIWEKNISDNKGDDRWISWRDRAISENNCGKASTFIISHENSPIGEGTLIFSPQSECIRGRNILADNLTTANINALRIQEEFEGMGHISKLMKKIELHAAQLGYSYLTIGVEAKESRNLAIYLHWGYNEFVLHEFEDGELVLYYRKKI